VKSRVSRLYLASRPARVVSMSKFKIKLARIEAVAGAERDPAGLYHLSGRPRADQLPGADISEHRGL
jgi:hypothetical protein